MHTQMQAKDNPYNFQATALKVMGTQSFILSKTNIKAGVDNKMNSRPA